MGGRQHPHAEKVPRLLYRSVADRNLGLFALTLDLMVPPLSLLVMLTVAMFLISGAVAFFGGSMIPFAISSGSLIALVAAIFLLG